MNNIRVAVIGLGYWGPNLVRNFTKIPQVSVTAGCDLSDKNLKALNRDFPSIFLTKDYKDIINNKDIDAIAIATPVSSHFSLAHEALISNKHVLLEKPMTKTSEQAKELIKIAKKNKRILMVGHTFVYSESIKKIKEYVDRGSLGKLYYYDSTRINLGLLQSDVNVVWDLAPHDLSILSYILKEKPLSVQAFGSTYVNKKHEEIAHIIITFENNITAHIHVSWLSPVKIRTVLIGGSKKMIVYDDIEPSEKIRVYDKNISISRSKITPFSPAYRSGDVIIPHLEQTESLFNELNHFVDCIRKNKKSVTSGEEGLKVVRLLEATDIALKTNKKHLFRQYE